MWSLVAKHLDEIRKYEHLYEDAKAMRRLWYRGYVTDAQATQMEKKLIKRLEEAKNNEQPQETPQQVAIYLSPFLAELLWRHIEQFYDHGNDDFGNIEMGACMNAIEEALLRAGVTPEDPELVKAMRIRAEALKYIGEVI